MDLNRIYQAGCSSLYITILLPRKMIVYRLALMEPNVKYGAGDGIRTRDFQLGKLTLYH
jgi:hypothetical protein